MLSLILRLTLPLALFCALLAKMLTIDEVAEATGFTSKTIRRRIRDGVLPAYRFPGCRGMRIKSEDLDAALVPVRPKEAGRC